MNYIGSSSLEGGGEGGWGWKGLILTPRCVSSYVYVWCVYVCGGKGYLRVGGRSWEEHHKIICKLSL